MLAHKIAKNRLCPGCGHPKATAWHSDNDGWYEVTETYQCNPCTVQKGPDNDGLPQPVEYVVVENHRDYEVDPLHSAPMKPNPDQEVVA